MFFLTRKDYSYKNMIKKKKDFEINFYEKLIKHNPNFVQALLCLGEIYTKRGFYKEGLKIDKRLVSLRPDDPVVHYNLACSFSLVGDIDAAFRHLRYAVLLGYDDLDYILKDHDLENLCRDARFNDFFNKLKRLKT